MRKIFLFVLLITANELIAQQATWIWYPGDYEIWLANKVENRRTDRGSFFPVFWKVDSHYPLMDFHKTYTLTQPEQLKIFAEGQFNVKIDGRLMEGGPYEITVPTGTHRINIKVFNQQNVPAIFLQGSTIISDSSWLVTFEDKEWIDETGKTSDISATKWLHAGYWNFNDPNNRPSQFKLPVKPMAPVSVAKNGNEELVDFGKETFGFIDLHGLSGKGNITIYYGESKEEALSKNGALTFDKLSIDEIHPREAVMSLSKAFRYVNIVKDETMHYDSVSMLYEYSDLPDRGSFSCNDEQVNKIYDVAKYTLHLCTREFFVDGIKRDRWVWSGDAYQSYLMNYYLMDDNATVKRTMYALRGKDPVTSHINTIMDYTFYWFLSIYDYYMYTGDKSFIVQNYDRMKSMMDFVLNRRNKDGLLEGLPGDWIFIDWAAGLSKKGAVSFEQLLFTRSLQTMVLCANIMQDTVSANHFGMIVMDLRYKLFKLYWNPQKEALVHSLIDGKQTDNVTRYANMFAIFFNYFSEPQKQAVKKSVLLNDNIQKITTPYMQFYELEALCAMGEQDEVLKQIKSYWGGMLSLGATSFWEEYDASKKGAEHYAMYGREFGKSLCHAWGSSPIYLLGKYFLGVKPTSPGYATYNIEPNLGGLQWMQGKVPTPKGEISLYVSTKQIKVIGATGIGLLRFQSKSSPKGNNVTINKKENDWYEVTIEPGKEYVFNYEAVQTK